MHNYGLIFYDITNKNLIQNRNVFLTINDCMVIGLIEIANVNFDNMNATSCLMGYFKDFIVLGET